MAFSSSVKPKLILERMQSFDRASQPSTSAAGSASAYLGNAALLFPALLKFACLRTDDPLVKDCVQLFKRTMLADCKKTVELEVVSAQVNVISGFDVHMIVA